MRSMEKLDRRDPIAEYAAEELTSAAALDEHERARTRQMAEIRDTIAAFTSPYARDYQMRHYGWRLTPMQEFCEALHDLREWRKNAGWEVLA